MNCIILKGIGEKAFCAGGDVKGVVQQILRGEQDEAVRQAKQFCLAPTSAVQYPTQWLALQFSQNFVRSVARGSASIV